MERRLTLAQKLTMFIAVSVIGMSAIVFVFFFAYFQPGADRITTDSVQRGAESSALVYASRWNYDIITAKVMASEGNADGTLERNISAVLQESPVIVGMAVFAKKDSAADARLLKDSHFMMIAQKSREELNVTRFLSTVKDFRESRSLIMNDYVFSGAPVMVEDQVEGYLVYVESMKKYNEFQARFSVGMTLLLICFMVIQLVAVFVVGNRAVRPIKTLADTASKIAAGDLSQTIDIDKSEVAETAILSASIRDMSRAINEQVTLIKELTQNVSSVSRDVSRAMSHMAGSAAEQAAAVSETATTVEEMEKTGKNVAGAVKRIVDAAERSAEASNRGRDAVDAASSIIIRIKEDSGNISRHSRALLSNVEEIGNIINSVNAISEQSKILAVNASIEAAKAGEFGAGFAVVAQEVKNLAGQSKEATEQITHTLTSIRQAIENMVRMARDGEERTVQGVSQIASTGAIVNDLSEAIQEASMVAAEIDSAVSQQAMGLSQIATAMDEINASAAENQDISHQMEQSTAQISNSLEELAVLVDVWNTTEAKK